MSQTDGDELTPEQKAALQAFLANKMAQPPESTSMDDSDLADIEREVTQAIAADPRAAYLLLISVAQAWGQCLYDLGFSLDAVDENHAAMDQTFGFVPAPIRTAVKTYAFIGHQIGSGAIPSSDE